MKYVNEALRGMWHEVALGETGSLVVQNIFENCLEEDKVCVVLASSFIQALADKSSVPALTKFSSVSISLHTVSSGIGAFSISGELSSDMHYFYLVISDVIY